MMGTTTASCFILLSIFVAISTSSHVFLGLGYADSQETVQKCMEVETNVWFFPKHGYSLRLMEQCAAAKRLANSYMDHKDALTIAIEAMMLVRSADYSLVHDTKGAKYYREKILNFVEDKYQREVGNEVEVNIRHAFYKDKYFNLLPYDWEEVGSIIASINSTWNVFDVMGVDIEKVMNYFKIEDDYKADFYKKFHFKFICEPVDRYTNRKIHLKICGNIGVTRYYGSITKVAPKGQFVNGGGDFAFYKAPELAIIVQSPQEDQELHSVQNCSMVGRTYHCVEISKTECSVENYIKCGIEVVHSSNGVFVKEVNGSYFVATFVKKYVVWNGATSFVREVYESGQFWIELPYGWHATFGNRRISGRREKEFIVIPVLTDEYNKDLEYYVYFKNRRHQGNQTNVVIPNSTSIEPTLIIPIDVPEESVEIRTMFDRQFLDMQWANIWELLSNTIPKMFIFAFVIIVVTFLIKTLYDVTVCCNCFSKAVSNLCLRCTRYLPSIKIKKNKRNDGDSDSLGHELKELKKRIVAKRGRTLKSPAPHRRPRSSSEETYDSVGKISSK